MYLTISSDTEDEDEDEARQGLGALPSCDSFAVMEKSTEKVASVKNDPEKEMDVIPEQMTMNPDSSNIDTTSSTTGNKHTLLLDPVNQLIVNMLQDNIDDYTH